MDYDDYIKEGWTIHQYDDNILDTVDKFNEQLKAHNLFLELADDECDGFQPMRIVKRG